MIVPLLVACTGDPNPIRALFALPYADLGAPVASATGFDAADGTTVGRALDSTLPVFEAIDPGWQTPTFLFDELLTDERVRDPNQCPFVTVSGEATVHEGGCRSSGGYDYIGSASDRSWTEDGVAWRSLDLDLEVVGDTEDVLFDRVLLSGVVQRGVPEDDAIDAHVDINLRIEVEGYFERHGDDPRTEAWAAWSMSGAWEETGDAVLADLSVDVAGGGGMMVRSEALTAGSGCPIEVRGDATLGDGVTATFAGVDGCDACAEIVFEGGTSSACAP